MAYQLVAEVLDHAPADLTPAQRLVLVVLAESADTRSRQCYPGRDVLTRRTGLTLRSVRRVLDQLAARGIEVRVAIGVGSDGRPVYATGGRRTVYRIPALAAVQEGDTSDPLTRVGGGRVRPPEGDTGDPLRGTPATEEGDTSDPPSVMNRNGTVMSSRTREPELLAAVRKQLQSQTDHKITNEWAERVTSKILSLARTPPQNPAAYIRTVVDKDPGPYLPTPCPSRTCVLCPDPATHGNRCARHAAELALEHERDRHEREASRS